MKLLRTVKCGYFLLCLLVRIIKPYTCSICSGPVYELMSNMFVRQTVSTQIDIMVALKCYWELHTDEQRDTSIVFLIEIDEILKIIVTELVLSEVATFDYVGI